MTMLAHHALRKTALLTRQAIDREVNAVLAALRAFDPDAALLTLPGALASRDIAGRLWKALPDEADTYVFESPDAMIAAGHAVLEAPLDEPVVLHLGWDCLAVRATLDAAWHGWPRFCDVSTAAHNALVYPESLRWYIVRAGPYLYPMTCEGEGEPAIRSLAFPTSRARPGSA